MLEKFLFILAMFTTLINLIYFCNAFNNGAPLHRTFHWKKMMIGEMIGVCFLIPGILVSEIVYITCTGLAKILSYRPLDSENKIR